MRRNLSPRKFAIPNPSTNQSSRIFHKTYLPRVSRFPIPPDNVETNSPSHKDDVSYELF